MVAVDDLGLYPTVAVAKSMTTTMSPLEVFLN